ncbi:MAG: hypothetical protein ACI9DF_005663 [Verrucomicrobiales bacterium]|jgi:hypothetical protein
MIERYWPDIGRELPYEDSDVLLNAKSNWEYLTGRDPEDGWTTGEGWEEGSLPIGYGYNDLRTELDDMRGQYQRVYLRAPFELKDESEKIGLGLSVAWDDAFIAYINGVEVIRVGVESGRGKLAKGIYKVVNAVQRYFPLDRFQDTLKVGKNTLAIEGYNGSLNSSDFVIISMLVRMLPKAKQLPLPKEIVKVIPKHSRWRYLASKEAPPEEWEGLTFDDTDWPLGKAGFGYGDDDDQTVLQDMEDEYSAVYVRRSFKLTGKEVMAAKLGLGMRWDDGFIAYLNGNEIIRQNVGEGSGEDAEKIQTAEAEKEHVAFRLEPFAAYLKEGKNVIAIEGHNARKESSDFTLDPFLFQADWE